MPVLSLSKQSRQALQLREERECGSAGKLQAGLIGPYRLRLQGDMSLHFVHDCVGYPMRVQAPALYNLACHSGGAKLR